MEKSNAPFEITKEKSTSTNKETKSEREIECSQPDFLDQRPSIQTLRDVYKGKSQSTNKETKTEREIECSLPDFLDQRPSIQTLARRNYWEQRMTKEDTKQRLRKKLASKKESNEESKEETKEENICSNKNCSNKGTLMCSRCKKKHYCSSKCQTLDWSNHRTECKKVEKVKNTPKADSKAAKAPAEAPKADTKAPAEAPKADAKAAKAVAEAPKADSKAQKAQKGKDKEFGMYFKNDFKGLRPVISTFLCFNIKENESFMFYLETSKYGAFISEIFLWAYNNKIDVFYDENIVLFGFTFLEKLDGKFEEFCMTSEKAIYAYQCYKNNLEKGNDIHEINAAMKRPSDENESGWSYTKYDHIIRDNNKVVLDMIKSNGKKWSRLIIINSILYKFIDYILKIKKSDKIMFCDSEIIDIRKPSSFEEDYLSMLIDLEKEFQEKHL